MSSLDTYVMVVDFLFKLSYFYFITKYLWRTYQYSGFMSNKCMNMFQSYGSLKSVLISCFRRLLTFTLFRHWGLAQLVLQDTIAIFKLGEWLDLFMASAVKNLNQVLVKASSFANIIVPMLTKSQNGDTPMLYSK